MKLPSITIKIEQWLQLKDGKPVLVRLEGKPFIQIKVGSDVILAERLTNVFDPLDSILGRKR